MADKNCKLCRTSYSQVKNEQYCCLKCAVLSRSTVLGPEDCWEWQGPIGSHGYGVFSFLSVQYTAHRASYLANHGEVPAHEGAHGGVIMHSCDNRRCVNPKHLSAGSQAQNLEDAKQKGRAYTGGPKGESARTAILTVPLVLEIRQRLADGETGLSLAAEYGVTASAISSIKARKSWKHI